MFMKMREYSMGKNEYPSIDAKKTGENICKLRIKKGLSVRDLQEYFGFEKPTAIYNWQRGLSLPKIDNFYALSIFLEISINDIIVPQEKRECGK